ncbi:MAG: PLP-dependent aminotransferase family protein, partial [Alphaproteobacteria bacterium]|nr:PLP-dependent aminotransferase family protein [Alphaproteobacteria bacterium]
PMNSRSSSAFVAGLLPDDDFVDLARNFPVSDRPSEAIVRAIAESSTSPDLAKMLAYAPNLGLPAHRAAGVEWLARHGLRTTPGEVAVCDGAQHATMLAMAATARAGDVILTEQLTFYGMKSIATLLGLRLHGVAMDEYGLLPEALEAACRQVSPKALYCTPTLQNPTTALMPAERREAIAEICRRYGVVVVEDDIYGFLCSDSPPPVSSFAPDNSIFVTSFSKCVAPGLRIGYVKAPAALLERIGSALRATTWMATPLMAEIAARLVRSGDAARLADSQRAEAIVRQKIAAQHLGDFEVATHPSSFHLWLTLPEPWRREEFTIQARQRRVGVAPAEAFAVGRAPVPHAVRIGLSAARDRTQLARALGILAELLREVPDRGFPVV